MGKGRKCAIIITMNDLEKIIYTLGLSNLHKNWTTIDIINRILPPIKLKQYIFISNKKTPLFYASWAFMNQEASDAREFSKRSIHTNDWNRGHVPWIMDIVCPMGGTAEGIKELKKVPNCGIYATLWVPFLFYFYIDDSPVDFSEYMRGLLYIYNGTANFFPRPPLGAYFKGIPSQ